MNIHECLTKNLWPGSEGAQYHIPKMHDTHLRNAYLKSLRIGGERIELLGLLYQELLNRDANDVPHPHYKMMARFAELAEEYPEPWRWLEWRRAGKSSWHQLTDVPAWAPMCLYREAVDPYEEWLKDKRNPTLRQAFEAGMRQLHK